MTDIERGDFCSSTGDEGYGRAKVMESNGKVAWIQSVPVGAAAPK